MHDQTELQATQHIIALFENSKAQTDATLESLPGIYAVIGRDGEIFKGNRRLATLFQVDHENLLGLNLADVFQPEDWLKFQSRLTNLSVDSRAGFDFQINVKTRDDSSLNYLWHAATLATKREDLPPLFTIIGRDVTDLNRATETSTRMQMELNTAKTVQDTLFPQPNIKFKKSSIAGFYESASECGGDWWHYTILENRLLLWIGDVTGHGVPAALLTAAVHSAVSIIENADNSVTEAMSLLNRAVYATGHGQKVMTFLILSIDLATGDCTYVSAAHEPAILIPAGKAAISVRELRLYSAEPTLPLGSSSAIEFKEYRTNMRKGDRIFVYTDGIYDIVNHSGQSWNRSKFRRELALSGSQTETADDLTALMARVIKSFRGDSGLIDDVTFFTFQF